MNDLDKHILKIINEELNKKNSAYNIRKNGSSIDRASNNDIKIISKEDKPGIDIFVNDNVKEGYVHIPVLITQSGLSDKVYNDFHIGKNSNVVINAGCGIHNDKHKDSEHEGIHRFYLAKNSHVKYIEKHYGEGEGSGKRILNPVTEVYLSEGAVLEMDTAQIKGVSSTIRKTKGTLKNNSKLILFSKRKKKIEREK